MSNPSISRRPEAQDWAETASVSKRDVNPQLLSPFDTELPSRRLTYPTLGKGKSSTQKYLWGGDMLVAWRVRDFHGFPLSMPTAPFPWLVLSEIAEIAELLLFQHPEMPIGFHVISVTRGSSHWFLWIPKQISRQCSCFWEMMSDVKLSLRKRYKNSTLLGNVWMTRKSHDTLSYLPVNFQAPWRKHRSWSYRTRRLASNCPGA